MSARGTITSSTRTRWKPSTFFSIARSWGEKSVSSIGLGQRVLEVVAERIARPEAEAGQEPVDTSGSRDALAACRTESGARAVGCDFDRSFMVF